MANPKMIVIDDEQDIADMVMTVGEMAGFDVRATYAAADFMSIWEKMQPDVIVMDLVMPDMDGVELLLWLSERKCTAAIILMSGYDGQYLKMAEHLGGAKGDDIIGTLTKPFEIAELEAKLAEALASSKS